MIYRLRILLATCMAVASLSHAQMDITSNTLTTSNTTAEQPWIQTSGAAWVWPAAVGDGQNQYVQVLENFTIPGEATSSTQLAISADTNYCVWLNGQLAGFGQWSDYPDDKSFDLVDLAPQACPGENRLCITVWYQGLSSSQYRKGPPGVVFAVRAADQVIATSGAGTRMRKALDYVSGPVPRVSGQLSFTFEHRADRDDSWLAEGYQPGGDWHAATAAEVGALATRPVRPRPIKKLTYEPRLPMRIVSQGVYVRNDQQSSAGIAMQGDSLSFRAAGDLFMNPMPTLDDAATTGIQWKPEAWKGFTGGYIVLDTGKEEAGVLDLELHAPAGTQVDIGYGEHLEDLRVRTSIGGRSFGSRYVCREGHQQFMHPFLRLAGRYIQLHIQPPPGDSASPIYLEYAGMRPTRYPVAHAGSFTCPDALHNRIWEVSKHTLDLCMHEHYEDCPWREQALYAMDARNQALAGYYTFGNYDFARASIYLLGKGMNKDGFLELCAPAEVPITIPSFSLAWILMLDDYLQFSGDRDFVQTQIPVVRQILETCTRETSGPVIATPRGGRNWNFYEWAPGLDGGEGRVTKARYDAPLNLFYLLALDATTHMAQECGDDVQPTRAQADALRSAFASTFWDKEERGFRTRVGEGEAPHYAELTQSLAILTGVVPPAELDALRDRLASDNNWVRCTISHTLYKFEALLTDSERHAPTVFKLIQRDWGYMLGQGATTFWETIEGASAFGNAGSLCHGWSGIPAYFYGRYLLGVSPTSPGFSTHEMKPVRGVGTSAEGRIPTPKGVLQAQWSLEGDEVVKSLVPVN